MRLNSVEAIVHTLHDARGRYLVVGGLAANGHGHLRLTTDIDLVLQPNSDTIARTLDALERIGYRPIAPVASRHFADQAIRDGWSHDKARQTWRLGSDHHAETPIDLLVHEPFRFDFDAEYDNALVKLLDDILEVRFVSIPTLIRMKEITGRAQDRADIEHLWMRLEDDTGTQPATDAIDWRLTTFEGLRRERLRRWSRLSLQQMLEAVEQMADLSRRFREMRERGQMKWPADRMARSG